MGVPSFFRWLTKKYPAIVAACIEKETVKMNGVSIPIDSSEPNPNGVEFDNLYLDMNGIIHPCTHPEDKPAPRNEDEMMIAILNCIDRLFKIVRPRKLLYMAIDGVAPRAKMNQQRSRRFRAAKEGSAKLKELRQASEGMLQRGIPLPPERNNQGEPFDSNCITPGTPFMARLSDCLHHYIHDRMNNDSGWKNVKVILSDANVPGEGEHKIMDFIRKQRAQPDQDPNIHHCLYGADADLIMLGLATHEVNFTIIREEFNPNKSKPCERCGKTGHNFKDCFGGAAAANAKAVPFSSAEKFIFLKLNVLREYLGKELQMPNLPFSYDFERALDDWIFISFLVGNDFLPHLPSLEIREGAIDRLVNLYKQCVYKTKGFITNNGDINLEVIQTILMELAKVEDSIFRKRHTAELKFNEYEQQKRKKQKYNFDFSINSRFAARPIGNDHKQSFGQTKKEEKGHRDEVRLWEDGYKDRYYASKFGVASDDLLFRNCLVWEYIRGLSWVLQYYYQGCPSWKWYFPYHYAPFASDFMIIVGLNIKFEKGTKPLKPLEQLMSVFPASSRSHVPEAWADLMVNLNSPIIDFYPNDFKIDLNGKKFAWQGVALLPFVDESRLFEALTNVYDQLTPVEKERNSLGDDRLYIGASHKDYSRFRQLYHRNIDFNSETAISIDGLRGNVLLSRKGIEHGKVLVAPIKSLPTIEYNQVCCVSYRCLAYSNGLSFPATNLECDNSLSKVLSPDVGMTSYSRVDIISNGGNKYNVPPPGYENKNNIQGNSRYTPDYTNGGRTGYNINNNIAGYNISNREGSNYKKNINRIQENVPNRINAVATVGSARHAMQNLQNLPVDNCYNVLPPVSGNISGGQNGNYQNQRSQHSYSYAPTANQHYNISNVEGYSRQQDNVNNRNRYGSYQNNNDNRTDSLHNRDSYSRGGSPHKENSQFRQRRGPYTPSFDFQHL